MTPEEEQRFWASVDVDGRTIERLYVLILSGADKAKFLLDDDTSKAWDVIAQSIRNNPPPAGSIHEIPSFN